MNYIKKTYKKVNSNYVKEREDNYFERRGIGQN